MKDMVMFQDKFLMMAEKLGLSNEILGKMKEEFSSKDGMSEGEGETKTEVTIIKKESPEGETPVDISKRPEEKIPSIEDIDGMGKEDLAILAKKLITKLNKTDSDDVGVANGQENSPFMAMIKKHAQY